MISTRVTAPELSPVTVEDISAQTRVEIQDDGALLMQYVRAATAHLETISGRAFITQGWSVSYSGWIRDRWGVRLPLPVPVAQSVSAMRYVDRTGVEQTVNADQYRITGGQTDAPVVALVDEFTTPDTSRREDAITINYIAGYGDNPADVPEDLRHAVLMLASQMYEHRDPFDVDRGASQIPYAIMTLVQPYRKTNGTF